MSDHIKAGPFLGMNTKLPSEKLVAKDGSGAFVRDALNVDLTTAGTFQRRGGITQVLASARASSLWSAPSSNVGYFVDNGVLKAFDGTNFTTLRTLTNSNATVSFSDTPPGVVWSDGTALELIANGVSSPLAVPTPNPVPMVSASTGGALKAGTYMVAFSNAYLSGQRSPITFYQAVTVVDGGAIVITATNAEPYDTQVLVSSVNGTQLYFEAILPAASTTLTINFVYSQGTPIQNEVEAAMPPGVYVRYYRGRLLTVVGNLIYYSEPYNYGVTIPATNYIALDDVCTLCEPTQTGIFLATSSNTWFLDGEDMTKAPLKPLAPYGAIPGTAAQEPNALNMYWMTPRGLVHTKDDNTLEMRQDDAIAFSAATVGASLYREENGLAQVISAVSNAVPTGAASASSYMTATTVN